MKIFQPQIQTTPNKLKLLLPYDSLFLPFTEDPFFASPSSHLFLLLSCQHIFFTNCFWREFLPPFDCLSDSFGKHSSSIEWLWVPLFAGSSPYWFSLCNNQNNPNSINRPPEGKHLGDWLNLAIKSHQIMCHLPQIYVNTDDLCTKLLNSLSTIIINERNNLFKLFACRWKLIAFLQRQKLIYWFFDH